MEPSTLLTIIAIFFLPCQLMGCGNSDTNNDKDETGSGTVTSKDKGNDSANTLNSSSTKAPVKEDPVAKTFEALILAQQSPDPDTWLEEYERNFEKMLSYEEKALPVLEKSLKSKDQMTRETASVVFASIGPSHQEASKDFIQFIKDPSELVRVNIIAAFSLITGYEETVDQELKKLLNSKDETIVATATGSALHIGERAQKLLPELKRIIDNPDSPARVTAIKVIGNCKTSDDTIKKLLKSIASNSKESPEAKAASQAALKSLDSPKP